MATNTYVALRTSTISGTSTNSINLDNIPQGYTDLIIVANTKTIGLPAVVLGTFNNDTSSLYSHTAMGGTGSGSGGSTRSSSIPAMYFSSYAHQSNTWSTYVYNIMNYSNTNINKTMIGRGSNAGYGVDAVAALYRSNNAITSVQIFLDRAEYWEPGSTFTVYGITANDNSYSAKATGGTITADAGYVYHTFTNTGTFTPTETIANAEILVVAGGGGGYTLDANSGGGGGGAGGLLSFAGPILSPGTSYTCTVGAGGATSTTGSNSQFGSLQLVYGGGNGGYGTGGNGGSGGGIQGGTVGQGYAGPPRQGYDGASAGGVAYNGWPFGGGGGAGRAGYTPANNSVGGNGGDGSSAYSDWGRATSTGQNVSGTYWYAGGGGGGTYIGGSGLSASQGGKGGGGNGNAYSNGTSGAANTGGGGGGCLNTSIGGGSGVVIVRYPK